MKKIAITVIGVLASAGSANEVPTLGTWQTNLNTWRSLFPKRLIGLAISTILISFVTMAAHADDVLILDTVKTDLSVGANPPVISSYTFNSSMILNSIGFASHSTISSLEYRYSINGGTVKKVTPLATIVNGVRWFILATPITLNATDVVYVQTKNGGFFNPKVPLYFFTAVSGFDITVVGNNRGQGANKTNSNLRVSALPPGASVAPEPGTLAMALTGGIALVGMCIRRRRMSN
jgi:hypothetical protein